MMSRLGTFLILFSFFISATNAISNKQPNEAEKWVKKYISQPKEKVARLHFYLQDNLSGPDATLWEVARSKITSNSSSGFGQVTVLDDLITAGPDRNSKKLGRAQGIIISSDLQELSLAMNINIVFTAGPYKGSTLSILGRNAIGTTSRELPVVGGTGIFRMARGFAISNTHAYDTTGNYGVLEYTVYVFYV
ncbi:hypothetical protein CASFOL_024289 [Castilleja foliolosa]|uniref:Dirigent protein n=1 Tax=Castilleja foliolosa TaxID=1961234 RepID=A0ABD3CMV2_9LAMI